MGISKITGLLLNVNVLVCLGFSKAAVGDCDHVWLTLSLRSPLWGGGVVASDAFCGL